MTGRSLAELRNYLAGEWLFENDFKDSSGDGNDGTPTGIEWKPTARGLKPKFNGATSEMDVNSNFSKSFTLSGLVLVPDTSGSEYIVYADNVSGTKMFRVYVYQNKLAFRFWNGELDSNGISSLEVPQGEFFFFSGAFDSSTNKLILCVNGEFEEIAVSGTNYDSGSGNISVGYRPSISHGQITIGSIYIHSLPLIQDEQNLLYNSTKHAHGVIPCTRSYTHRLTPPTDDNTVFATDMHAKQADGTLLDLSGNSNHGTINGAVRSSGYFMDSMRFGGVDDFILMDYDTSLNVSNALTIDCMIETSDGYCAIADWYGYSSKVGYALNISNEYAQLVLCDGSQIETIADDSIPLADGKRHVVRIIYDGNNVYFIIDGNLSIKDTTIQSIATMSDRGIAFGVHPNLTSLYEGIINYVTVSSAVETVAQAKSRFNSLAVLPLFSFDASKYPTSSGWTGNIPYTPITVTSGEFEFTDDGKLKCTSAGTLMVRNAHEFDGAEYITLTVDGVKTSDTGSVTAGTTTASITQGSSLIAVEMGTDDTLDALNIQFRKEVA